MDKSRLTSMVGLSSTGWSSMSGMVRALFLIPWHPPPRAYPPASLLRGPQPQALQRSPVPLTEETPLTRLLSSWGQAAQARPVFWTWTSRYQAWQQEWWPRDFPGSLVVKNLPCNTEDRGFL